ncbi:hypothetical protein M431DRAFT_512073 [Trichoderma harzianum CBS 226.95]|uniref:Uncharacterized protein n=1 Tax=Trichoderma harzianum CBS 226.95 TaxID=983964 RepID=A0A2T4A0E7_TRIHA|nr:hypothetical protein M431DRAFT_512073 [Trichoderma harzianum CBS 226.95]PTB50498.1 hypothetical protein M431DRAFT_512073 [Trichoderma harzianum CBS 226.95]
MSLKSREERKCLSASSVCCTSSTCARDSPSYSSWDYSIRQSACVFSEVQIDFRAIWPLVGEMEMVGGVLVSDGGGARCPFLLR